MKQVELKEILDYNPDTGDFTWLVNKSRIAKIGDRAGCININGYRHIIINGKCYKASRLAYLWMEGIWPPNDMDHINRNPSDDRWCNLRPVTRSQNCVNRKRSKRCLPIGVYHNGKKFIAIIKINRKNEYLGTYDTPEEASNAFQQIYQKIHGDTPC